jgi:hypothetical protein
MVETVPPPPAEPAPAPAATPEPAATPAPAAIPEPVADAEAIAALAEVTTDSWTAPAEAPDNGANVGRRGLFGR